ncbi:tumor necrosis factor receptor superfamily member 27 [Hyperolius riggenbachi]|uniref:tumor necrosis factor receptor superfamily member 27 n=1 Tax=Hyperolius riggenbachi TaxID=752182 RepID=UPI0035A3879C
MMTRGYLLCILLFMLVIVCQGISACLENEYEDEQGNCFPCIQCGPGEELSEECGNGKDIQCIPCKPGRYKEDRGHQQCRRCLSCAVINREQKLNCTLTTNSLCGDCLPGFYSKTRIGGLQELECFPCTSHTPQTETQCNLRPGFGWPKSTDPPPPRDPAILVAVIIVALALILITLVTFSIICCGHFFKSQCHRAFQRSRGITGQSKQQESAGSPCEEQPIPSFCFGSTETSGKDEGPLDGIHVISENVPCSPRTTTSALLSPSVELCALPPPSVKPLYNRSVSETQPLIRNSGCSDCFSGCGPCTDYNQGAVEPAGTQTHSCASEQQQWCHAPVECTELDLQNFSTEEGFSGTESQDHSGASERCHAVAKPQNCSCSKQCISCAKAQKVIASSGCRNVHCQFQKSKDLVSCLNIATLALPVCQMPESLVTLLALKLDNTTAEQKDFKDIGVALGVQPHLVDSMQGFKALHAHLSANISCTLLHLVETLQRLQRRDALTLICSYFGH